MTRSGSLPMARRPRAVRYVPARCATAGRARGPIWRPSTGQARSTVAAARRPAAGVRARRAGRRGDLDRRPTAGDLRVQPGRPRRAGRRPRRHPRPARPDRPGRHGPGAARPAAADRRRARRGARPAWRETRRRPAAARPAGPRATSSASASACPGPSSTPPGEPTNPPIMPGWDDADVPGLRRRSASTPPCSSTTTSTSWPSASTASAGRDVDHLLFVKVATGIGAGIIADGALRRGAQGAAGDIGHVAVPGVDRPAVPLRQHRLPGGRRQRAGDRDRAGRGLDAASSATSSPWSAPATSPRASAVRAGRPATSARCSPPASACSTRR